MKKKPIDSPKLKFDLDKIDKELTCSCLFLNSVFENIPNMVFIKDAKDLRFIRYGDYGMDLYSNTVFFSRSFVKDNPKAVQGFVKALNRAIKDVAANPDAGVDFAIKREPLLKRDVEKEKLMATMRNDMSHPEIARIGLGDVDDERLKRSINIVVDANQLPRTPAVSEVFDRSFLPVRADRPSKL